ncbi:hypothetical protein ZIOFF_017065 [Zingiber officinale]|uniref:Uncharacterized protein n=1 Tax=Zingiber officinale TaxID=94328 RepID=A0A8J5LI24_ZINOF|nr:hypothetical protein ZIOFF_017065 [Zingiber officinale]
MGIAVDLIAHLKTEDMHNEMEKKNDDNVEPQEEKIKRYKVHRHNNLPSPPREISDMARGSVQPKNICRLLNRQPQLPHRALTEKHPDASSADGEDDPLHFSVTLQQSSENTEEQPFFTTDLLYKLVKECVAMLDHLFPSNNLSISAECDGQNGVPKPAQSGGRVPELEEIKYMQSLYMKSTVAALRSLKHIRSKSSTVKTD